MLLVELFGRLLFAPVFVEVSVVVLIEIWSYFLVELFDPTSGQAVVSDQKHSSVNR